MFPEQFSLDKSYFLLDLLIHISRLLCHNINLYHGNID
jgi:hypothetical protein